MFQLFFPCDKREQQPVIWKTVPWSPPQTARWLLHRRYLCLLHAKKWTTWSMLSTTCCNAVLHPVNNCCQRPLLTVVHVQKSLFNHCQWSTCIVNDQHWQWSTSFFIHQLLSALVPTTLSQPLFLVNIEQLLIEQYSSTLRIQQALLNVDNNIVQALFSEQCCINLINFCAYTWWNLTDYSYKENIIA